MINNTKSLALRPSMLANAVAQGVSDTGGMLLQAIVSLGLGAVMLSAATQATLLLWRHSVVVTAVEQANQRALSVVAELSQAIALTDELPAVLRWSLSSKQASLATTSFRTGNNDRYLWDEGTISVQRLGQRSKERLADGITFIQWQPDDSQQGGWLRVDAVSNSVPFSLPAHYRLGCPAADTQACRTIVRYIAHPTVPSSVRSEPQL